jgi:serine phosphatase RsbU (regulator of sigma subunit)
MKTPPEDLRRLLAVALLGAAVLAAGLALAFRLLPEWRAVPVPSAGPFVERYREIGRGLEFAPLEGERPHTGLVTQAGDIGLVCAKRQPGEPAVGESFGVCAEVRQAGELPGDDRTRELSIFFAADGAPRAAAWVRNQILNSIATDNPVAPRERAETFARLLLAPGESLRPPRNALLGLSPALFYELAGSAPAEHVRVLTLPGGSVIASREHGTAAEGVARNTTFRWLPFGQLLFRCLFVLGVLILFFVLVGKGRIDVINGALLAALLLLTLIPELFVHDVTPGSLLVYGLVTMAKILLVFLVWSAGESFLRSYQPNFTTSLDALRAGRLGPRGGRALLYGLALGVGLAGLRLAILSAGTLVPEAWPQEASLSLPLASLGRNMVGHSFMLSGTVMLALAVALRVLPARWAPFAAAVAVVLCWPPHLHLESFWIEMAARFLIAGSLIAALRAFGMTTLLTATVAFYLLPAAFYSGLNLTWMPWTFLGAAGTPAAFLVLGLIGLRRPASVEAQRLAPPAFMRRLEEERRLRYEMQLLARMQEGLLPQVPELPGWDIAARSILATEAGGDLYDFLFDEDGQLWVAVGDVAGHGYSCAIVQAMTTAALTSLIRPGARPSEILLQVDRVIRRGGSPRNFASLTLLRLDPQSGEVVISNAGHPFPLLVQNSDVSEIVLPGLPLGKGPQRRYQDVTLHLPPGAALVFCSDGLIETQDWQENPYGFDRPREILRHTPSAPAASLLENLLADWRRHLGTEEPPDDTTVVVVRRAG